MLLLVLVLSFLLYSSSCVISHPPRPPPLTPADEVKLDCCGSCACSCYCVDAHRPPPPSPYAREWHLTRCLLLLLLMVFLLFLSFLLFCRRLPPCPKMASDNDSMIAMIDSCSLVLVLALLLFVCSSRCCCSLFLSQCRYCSLCHRRASPLSPMLPLPAFCIRPDDPEDMGATQRVPGYREHEVLPRRHGSDNAAAVRSDAARYPSHSDT